VLVAVSVDHRRVGEVNGGMRCGGLWDTDPVCLSVGYMTCSPGQRSPRLMAGARTRNPSEEGRSYIILDQLSE
jgi:hypothetical protein